MAFPTVSTTASTSDNDSSSPWTENLPASIAAGDLLIMVAHEANNNTALTWPAGWIVITSQDSPTGAHHMEVAYKIADGTEGATISISGGGGTARMASAAYRITAWHGTTPPEVGTAATGTSTNPDPPTVTASWGSADNLFVAAMGQNNIGNAVTAAPTNYSNLATGRNTGGTAGQSGKAALGSRQLAASNDNPGTFTCADNNQWETQTIVVRPVVVAGRSHGYIF